MPCTRPTKQWARASASRFWTPMLFLAIVMSGLTLFVAQLFPWPILAAIIAYVSIGVGMATLRRVDPKYLAPFCSASFFPAGAVVATAINSALPALKLSAANPVVQAELNRSIYWSSVLGTRQRIPLPGFGGGFSDLRTDRPEVRPRGRLVPHRRPVFSWFGLMHSAMMRWAAQPDYAAGGWLRPRLSTRPGGGEATPSIRAPPRFAARTLACSKNGGRQSKVWPFAPVHPRQKCADRKSPVDRSPGFRRFAFRPASTRQWIFGRKPIAITTRSAPFLHRL
jgi:hypothetical protein